MNLMDSRVYSRKSNYKGLLDTDECQMNQITTDDRHQHNHYVDNAQIDSAANELKYNKRIKTFTENNEMNGNYEQNYVQGDQDKQLASDQSENIQKICQQNTQNYEQNLGCYVISRNEQQQQQQNLIFCEKNEREKKFTNRKDMTTDNKINNHNNDAHNSNNDANDLAQHFNDRLQTQSIARTYKNPQQCGINLNENTMATYSPLLSNETLNGISHQECEQSFGKSYQNHE